MKTQTQEIERLNQIEEQKELIAKLSEMRQNIDLPDRVVEDLLWAERYRMERNLPCWFMTIPEIMLVYGSALLEMVDDQGLPWKVNGAIDLIIDDECRLINPARSFVHVFVQRQEDLNVEEIKKWLTTSGGFLHEKCQATEMQHLKYANTTTLADAMHRSIMAYMSGVTQIQSSIKKRHPLETTDEKDVQVEFDFFEKLQNESVRVKDEHIAKVRKSSGSIKDPVDIQLDEILTNLGISMAGFGVNKDDAEMDFGAKGETILKNLLLKDKEFEYVDNAEELLMENMKFIESYIGKDLKNGSRSHRVKGLSVILRMMSKLNDEQRDYFEEFLEEENINLTDSPWSSQCVHNFGTTTMFIRLALQFNQWYREKMDEGNLFTFAWFREELLYINNPEAPAYVRRCLSGKPTHEEIK
ncbi:MAG: hypothetical protein CMA53_01840 [Euryarchaeota archaeon]|jgi:hypothetical protein|nr:hypothetical protein [Euryarchaeota archaeon]|tara:strand:- start:2150 stop:3388 length:1239 start_codon:yes stop_codon:yes gene_type:complete